MNSDYRVYIPTRSRYSNLRKIVPRWLAQGFDVVLVVEPKEYVAHCYLVEDNKWHIGKGRIDIPSVSIIAPQKSNLGIGYARDFALLHAAEERCDIIVMSDDDLMPKRDEVPDTCTAQLLVDEMRARPDMLGLGAVRDYHSFLTKGEIAKYFGEIILCPGGWGMQTFALNTQYAIDLGGFDNRLTCFGEDAELMRQGIRAGVPWFVHCGVYMQSIGKRYAPGGLNAYADDKRPAHATSENWRSAEEIICRRYIYAMWPDYTSPPSKAPRVAWKKMYDDFIPHWRELSALHGGSLDA